MRARPARRRVPALLLTAALSGAAGVAADATSNAATPPSAEAQRWRATSRNAHFQGQLGPRQGPIRLSEFQPWVLRLLDAQGAPVYPARIGIGGGMPDHGHDLPTQPVVTEYLGEGRYLIEGIKLNMAGNWVIAFAVETPDRRDRLAFDVSADY